MCVSDEELRDGMNLGLEAIREEVARNGTEADKECLAYVLDMEAGNSDKAFQGGLKRDCGEDEILVQWIENVRLVDPPKSYRGWIVRGWIVLPVD